MPTALLFPTIETFPRGTLSSWISEDGAQVSEGEALFYVEHGDVILEIPSPASGCLHATGLPGNTYNAGEVIGSIE